jgi:hypothetical protein
MSQACYGWRGEIGAYIVGALDPVASAAVRRHLRTCRACRADYHDLLPVRDWLTRLALAEGPAAGRRPGGTSPRPVWPVRYLAFPRWLRAVTAVVAAAAVTILTVVLARPGPPAFQAADRVTGVHGRARLQATAAGTQIALLVTGLPADERCMLVAVSRNGTDVAATWSSRYDGTARVTGTSAIPESQLTALRVESADGHLMLSIAVGAASGRP